MPAPHSSASFGSFKKKIDDAFGRQYTGSQNAKKERKWRRKWNESRPRFNIFHSFSSGDAIFEGGCPSSLSPPLSLPHRGESLTSTLLAMTSIHRPTTPRMRSYNLLFQTTFFFTHREKKQLVSVSGASVWDTSEWEQSNRDQIHADILQLQMHIYKWRGGCTAFCLMPYYSNNLNTSRIVCTHVKIFPTKI